MIFTKETNEKLKAFMMRHKLSSDDLKDLAEILTSVYEAGLNDCMADYEKAKQEVL